MENRIYTERLILRRFTTEDKRDIQEIALSKEADFFASCDAPWPTDDGGIADALNYFAANDATWAVELKSSAKVIMFLNCNGLNGKGEMDVGHVINSRFIEMGYEQEALKALYGRLFERPNVNAIIAVWARDDKRKLAPLIDVGMRVVSEWQGDSFCENPDGSRDKFTACLLRVTREEFAH